MLLSVLLPSNRPNELNRFLKSAQFYSNAFDLCEFILVIDENNAKPSDTYGLDVKLIEAPAGKSVGELLHIAYQKSRGQYVLFCNDDVIVETPEWIHKLTNELSDEYTLYYLNDKLFEAQLSCFPIVSRSVLDTINFFPTPYKRYKIDDTLFAIFNKKKYLEDIVFRHTNDHGKQGFRFPDGRVYEVEPVAAGYDNVMWVDQAANRMRMSKLINGEPPTRIMVGLPTAEFARQARFYDNFMLLEKPIGTGISMAHGQSPAKSRNIIIDQALSGGFSHVFFVDDDVLLPPDTLTRLMSHNADIASGIYLQRNYPHRPFIFREFDEKNWASYYILTDQQGTLPIVAAGMGCLLIKTSVFEHLERPYIRLGELDSQDWCDDIGFFARLRNKGLTMIADLEVKCGHMGTAAMWPSFANGKWYSTYDTLGVDTASVPQVGAI